MKSVTKFCRICKQMLPVTAFGKKRTNRDGLQDMCSVCRNAYRREYAKRKPEIISAAKKRHYANRKEAILAKQMEWHRSERGRRIVRNRVYRQKFGITIEQYDEMLKSQNGVCAICQSPETGDRYKSLAVDHCHDTGAVRGLLCQRCNRGMGLFDDDIDRLNQAVNYLSSRYINQTNNKTT